MVAFTSMLHADSSTTILAPTHWATEQYLHERIPYVMLRNSWYLENYTVQLPQVLSGGVLLGPPAKAGSAPPPEPTTPRPPPPC